MAVTNDNRLCQVAMSLECSARAFLAAFETESIQFVITAWGPAPEGPQVADHLRKELSSEVRCSPRVQILVVTVPRPFSLRFPYSGSMIQQFVGKNVSVRRSTGTYVIVTVADVIISYDFWQLMKQVGWAPPRKFLAPGRWNLLPLDRNNLHEMCVDKPTDWGRTLYPTHAEASCLWNAYGDMILVRRDDLWSIRGQPEVFAHGGGDDVFRARLEHHGITQILRDPAYGPSCERVLHVPHDNGRCPGTWPQQTWPEKPGHIMDYWPDAVKLAKEGKITLASQHTPVTWENHVDLAASLSNPPDSEWGLINEDLVTDRDFCPEASPR
eukprot:TRINITY_DN7039_c0_g1_i1.p1 TRINITY_DN7039_c0_g1~~TRINITY_DN7039_c0_g1_i1.p1  ORF type:complete len:358 (-),score=46.62 TRINITY_DN7039_c0_g1_i1:9-986(-)